MLNLLYEPERRYIGRYLPDYSLTYEQVIIVVLAHFHHTATSPVIHENQDDLRRLLRIDCLMMWRKIWHYSIAFYVVSTRSIT